MNVIRHYSELVYCDGGKFVRQPTPPRSNHLPSTVQLHFAAYDGPEQVFTSLNADGHEIHSRLGIIVSLQTKGPPVMFIRIVLCQRYPSPYIATSIIAQRLERASDDPIAMAPTDPPPGALRRWPPTPPGPHRPAATLRCHPDHTFAPAQAAPARFHHRHTTPCGAAPPHRCR